MGETLLTLTLLTLVVLTIRRGKPVILDNPVLIQRPGQYHITLAPQLNRAQAFIEQIIKHWSAIRLPQQQDFATQYFKVADPKVFAKGENFYLLAIGLRAGVLYFQAVNPQPLLSPSDSHLNTVQRASELVMKTHPLASPAQEQDSSNLITVIESVTRQLHIQADILPSS
jgi:hypothetical protein